MGSWGGDGAEVIYALRNNNTLANLILNELSKEGQNIRKAYQKKLPSNPTKDYYYILRDTGITEPVIIEYGFLDSTKDDIEQLKNNYENYAEAVVRAILEYIGYSYPSESQNNTYIVKSGDSLWSIAKKLNVSVEELKNTNNLNSNLISINQVLKLPVTQNIIPNNNYISYTVKLGDTLYRIASNNNISTDKLIEYNNLESSIITPGQIILIPMSMDDNLENYISYVVKGGDNLYAIARTYGLSVEELMQFNSLNTNLLNIGQVLKIPTNNDITYVVRSGDNLYKIAKQFNVTIDQLREKNNLDSNLLNPGQILKI